MIVSALAYVLVVYTALAASLPAQALSKPIAKSSSSELLFQFKYICSTALYRIFRARINFVLVAKFFRFCGDTHGKDHLEIGGLSV